MDLNDLLDGLMTDMRKVSDTASMIGKPVKVGTSQMVPLLGVAIGFGAAATDIAGNGERRGGHIDGGGAGGTMVVTPRAFVVLGADGIPQLVVLKDGKLGTVQPAIELTGPRDAEALEAFETPKLSSSKGSGT